VSVLADAPIVDLADAIDRLRRVELRRIVEREGSTKRVHPDTNDQARYELGLRLGARWAHEAASLRELGKARQVRQVAEQGRDLGGPGGELLGILRTYLTDEAEELPKGTSDPLLLGAVIAAGRIYDVLQVAAPDLFRLAGS
jgi:hypothetical protein